MKDVASTGINGMGRFGLHLLQYWIERYDSALFAIDYINDDSLSLEKLKAIISTDKYLSLKTFLSFEDRVIKVHLPNDEVRLIQYTNTGYDDIPWKGKPLLFLECSGKHTKRSDWHTILRGSTKHVVISATSWTADQILVYGFNHKLQNKMRGEVISYGSCTVNAYVPLAKFIHDEYTILDSDVNVIHNVPVHKAEAFDTLERKVCTLEEVAPHLLNFLNHENFTVNYTLVPYTGVSILDFRFRLASSASAAKIKTLLNDAVADGSLKGLYCFSMLDNGPEEHKFSTHSAVLIESSVKKVGDNLYIHAYFDNENSANRYHDTVNCLVEGVT